MQRPGTCHERPTVRDPTLLWASVSELTAAIVIRTGFFKVTTKDAAAVLELDDIRALIEKLVLLLVSPVQAV